LSRRNLLLKKGLCFTCGEVQVAKVKEEAAGEAAQHLELSGRESSSTHNHRHLSLSADRLSFLSARSVLIHPRRGRLRSKSTPAHPNISYKIFSPGTKCIFEIEKNITKPYSCF